MAITREFVQEVRNRLAYTPAIRMDALASLMNASESQVITALPVNMRIRARNSSLDEIAARLDGWTGQLRLEGPHEETPRKLAAEATANQAVNALFTAPSSPFKSSRSSIRGSRNLPRQENAPEPLNEGESCPLPRHEQDAGTKTIAPRPGAILSGLKLENLGYIWFVASQETGPDSHSVRFLDTDGNCMLAVYVDCSETDGLEFFEAMRAQFGVKSVPRVPFEAKPATKQHCGGCKNCTCRNKGEAHKHHAGHHIPHHAQAVA